MVESTSSISAILELISFSKVSLRLATLKRNSDSRICQYDSDSDGAVNTLAFNCSISEFIILIVSVKDWSGTPSPEYSST